MKKIDLQAVDALRVLSADMVQKANSGHPGMPLGAAPIAYTLWANHMNFDVKDTKWINRDRFILSAGPSDRYCFRFGFFQAHPCICSTSPFHLDTIKIHTSPLSL